MEALDTFMWGLKWKVTIFLVKLFRCCDRKEALSQYAQATDLTQTYQDSFAQFYEALNMVDKEEEYVKFIQEHQQ
jgi:hypothetical protein